MGAGLETAGQIRNVYPYMATEMLTVTPTFVSAGGTGAQLIPGVKPAFNRGPDRSGRIYVAINSLCIILSADSYTGTPTIIGSLQWADSGGRYILATIANVLTAPAVLNFHALRLSSYLPYFSENINDLGRIEFINQASALGGTATVINAKCFLNVGYYGDFEDQELATGIAQHTEVLHQLKRLNGDYNE